MNNCDYTKKHWMAHYTWVNCWVYELHLNKEFVLKAPHSSTHSPARPAMVQGTLVL